MKNFTYFIFFALFVQSYCQAARVTDVVLEYINPRYIETKLLEVKVNQHTHESNTLDLVTRVVKDFPQDTKVLARLYLVNSENRKIRLLYSSRIPLCKGDEQNYDYLPSFFKLIQSRSKCITKGQYQLKNIKDFNYSNLVPDLDKKGQYFKLEFTVYSFWTGRILKGYNLIKSSNLNEDAFNGYEPNNNNHNINNNENNNNYNNNNNNNNEVSPNHTPINHNQVKDNSYASSNSFAAANENNNNSNYPAIKNYGQVGPAASGSPRGNKY